jgi:16S rRNA (uracil1498-N3)-methyltransferase
VSTPPWFIVSPGAVAGEEIELDHDESHHALAVLRIASSDGVTVTDGAGVVARCTVTGVDRGRVVAQVLEREEHQPLRPQICVYTGAAKGAKVDGVVERLAELGAAEAVVYSSARSVANWDEAKGRRLSHRWRAIARSAAKQSRNPYLMRTGAPLSWVELLERVAAEPLAIVLWEEASDPLRTALVKPAERVAVVVGPEGGLTRAEAQALTDAGGRLVSLGSRILRTENAPVVTTSAVMFHYGLIG